MNNINATTNAPNGYTVSQNKFISIIYSYISGSSTLFDSWLRYVLDNSQHMDADLRRKSAIIFLYGSTDIFSHENKIDAYIERAKELNLEYLNSYIELINDFIKSGIEMYSLFTKEEQIYIHSRRTELVHGFFGGRLQTLNNPNNPIQMPLVIEKKFFPKEKINKDDYNIAISNIHENESWIEFEDALIDKWLLDDGKFNKYIRNFHDYKNDIHKSIYSGVPIKMD